MSSYTLRLFTENREGNLILINGKVGALRLSPFSVNTCIFDSITGYNGAYQIPSLTSSGNYKLFVGDSLDNLTEDKTFGGDTGFYIPCDDNNWTYDRINSIYLTNPTNNVLIGATGSDVNKFAVYGNASVTGNLLVTGQIIAPALSSLTAGISLTQYTLTSSFASTTGNLNTRINTVSSDTISLSSSVGNLNRFTTTSNFISATGNLQTQITSLSSSVGNLNRFVLTSSVDSITASLTGATIFNRTLATGKVFLTNTSNNVQLGADSGLTGIKLDVQGPTNLGNTTTIGVVGEKGRITWGSSPQATSFYSLSTNDVAIGTEQSGELIRGTTAGNIGIGTTIPNAKFTVLGNFSSTGTTTHIGNTSISGTLSNTGLLMSATSTNSGLFVLTSGRVGIGTNTPLQLIDVSSSQPVIRVTNTTNLGTTAWANTEIAKLEFYSADASAPSVVANISAIGSADSSGGVPGGDLTFFTKNVAGNLTEKFRINDLGHVSLTGGIINSNYANHSVTSTLLSGQSVTYNKDTKHIVAYNDAGTIKYRYLVLTGTDSNWTYSTIAP